MNANRVLLYRRNTMVLSVYHIYHSARFQRYWQIIITHQLDSKNYIMHTQVQTMRIAWAYIIAIKKHHCITWQPINTIKQLMQHIQVTIMECCIWHGRFLLRMFTVYTSENEDLDKYNICLSNPHYSSQCILL